MGGVKSFSVLLSFASSKIIMRLCAFLPCGRPKTPSHHHLHIPWPARYCFFSVPSLSKVLLTFRLPSPPGMEHERYQNKPTLAAAVTGGLRPAAAPAPAAADAADSSVITVQVRVPFVQATGAVPLGGGALLKVGYTLNSALGACLGIRRSVRREATDRVGVRWNHAHG